MPAFGALPPGLVLGAGAELGRVKVRGLVGVQFGDQLGVPGGEGPLGRDRSRSGGLLVLVKASRAAGAAAAGRDRGLPLVPAGFTAPPELLAGGRPEPEGVEVSVAGRVQLGDQLGVLDRE